MTSSNFLQLKKKVRICLSELKDGQQLDIF